MNKTINVTIAGLIFNIEEAGFQTLHDYLESVKRHFASVEYGSEVSNDIEARIAEQFQARMHETKFQSIAKTDVEAVIKSMGTVEDFGTEEKSGKTAAESAMQKKFYRSSDDVVIAGVAAGVAAYFGWDTTLVRVLFALTVLTGGWGVVLYLILWLVMPQAKTASEKLQMRGERVSLSKLEQTVRDRLDEAKSLPDQTKNKLSAVGNVIRRLVRLALKLALAFIKIILGVGSAVAVFAATMAAFGVTFFTVVMLFNPNSPYMDPVVAQSFSGVSYFFALIAGWLAVVLPLIAIVLLGVSIIRRRNSFNRKAIGALAAVWLISAMTFGAIVFHTAPKIEAAMNAEAANVVQKSFDLKDFKTIDLGGNFNATIVPGKTFAVNLSGPERSVEEAKLEVRDGKLAVSSVDKFRICFFCFSHPMDIQITMPDLESADISGSSNLEAAGFKSDKFNLRLSGAASADLKLETNELKITESGGSRLVLSGTTNAFILEGSGASRITGNLGIKDSVLVKLSGGSRMNLVNTSQAPIQTLSANLSGAASAEMKTSVQQTTLGLTGGSRVTITGNTDSLKTELSGASRLEASEFLAKTVDIATSGGSRAEINVTDSLKARASGGSDIFYRGNPKLDLDDSGGADIQREDQ